MAGAAGALLRAALAAKVGHVRQATSSYFRDRTEQGRSTISGYVTGAAFYAVAGIFMIAALLVGAAALFRWVELHYGLFTAFGITAAALVVLSALAAVIAASSMRPPKKNYPSLGSRLRVALRAGPAASAKTAASSSRPIARTHDHIASARNTASTVLSAPPSPRRNAASPSSPIVQSAGVAAAVGLLGWALARRYSQNRALEQTPNAQS